MDAVEYLKERARMCNSYERCSECPLLNVGCGESNPDETVDIVEQWSREHPVMTNAMKFEEVFGNKPDSKRKGERICPPLAFRKSKDCSCKCSECDQWWDEPYKEPEGKK